MIASLVDDLCPPDRNVARATSPAAERRLEERRRIVALGRLGVAGDRIAWRVGRHRSTVRRWLARGQAGQPFADGPRSGRPRRFGQDARFRVVAFYCQTSPLPGCGDWSLRWAAQRLRDHGAGLSMSPSTIARILSEQALRPHRNRYFLNITDPDFFPKMERLVALMLDPPPLLFFFDECTGLQAKSRLAPSLPPAPGRPGFEEFEYVRNGRTDLLAFLEQSTGRVFGRCYDHHRRDVLIELFTEHVALQPADAELHYVMDNLSTHYHDDLCRRVADLSGAPYVPLATGQERRDWLGSRDKRIAIHFTPFHGSWLNMIEIWFGVLSRKCLRRQSFACVEDLKANIEAFIETWNTHFAHPFTWRYRGEGLHEKVIRRFCRLLVIESPQMEIKFLTKQLLLMRNIGRDCGKSSTRDWWRLEDLVRAKSAYIDRIIESDEKARRRNRAREALEALRGMFGAQGASAVAGTLAA